MRPRRPAVTDGRIALRLREANDQVAIVAASHDPETQRWLEDDPIPPSAPGSSPTLARRGRRGSGRRS